MARDVTICARRTRLVYQPMTRRERARRFLAERSDGIGYGLVAVCGFLIGMLLGQWWTA